MLLHVLLDGKRERLHVLHHPVVSTVASMSHHSPVPTLPAHPALHIALHFAVHAAAHVLCGNGCQREAAQQAEAD